MFHIFELFMQLDRGGYLVERWAHGCVAPILPFGPGGHSTLGNALAFTVRPPFLPTFTQWPLFFENFDIFDEMLRNFWPFWPWKPLFFYAFHWKTPIFVRFVAKFLTQFVTEDPYIWGAWWHSYVTFICECPPWAFGLSGLPKAPFLFENWIYTYRLHFCKMFHFRWIFLLVYLLYKVATKSQFMLVWKGLFKKQTVFKWFANFASSVVLMVVKTSTPNSNLITPLGVRSSSRHRKHLDIGQHMCE